MKGNKKQNNYTAHDSLNYEHSKSKAKFVPVLNEALRHEDAWGSGGIAPFILNLRTRWPCGLIKSE